MGTGKSLADSRWLALDASDGKKCKGVYRIVDTTPLPGTLMDLNVALDCGGKTGGGVAAPFKFVLDGQKFGGCSLTSFNDNLGGYYLLCGPSQTVVDDCAKSAFDELVADDTQGSPSVTVPNFIFHPK
jgi:hypothetical protein